MDKIIQEENKKKRSKKRECVSYKQMEKKKKDQCYRNGREAERNKRSRTYV